MLHIYIYLVSRGSDEQVLKQVSRFCYISFLLFFCLTDDLFFSSPLYGDFILSFLFPPLFIFFLHLLFYIVFTHILHFLPLTYTYILHTDTHLSLNTYTHSHFIGYTPILPGCTPIF